MRRVAIRIGNQRLASIASSAARTMTSDFGDRIVPEPCGGEKLLSAML